jgi:serine/threonine-protein kinase
MSDLEPSREIAGRYRVVRFIGKGGMGSVYEVEHLHTGQHLAMKVLAARQAEPSVERFKREARAASRIQSDHVVRVTDADVAPELEGAPFLVMELLEGSDLERATAGGPTPAGDVLEWLRQVARALVKAHDAGIVHRDLKPENLFLTRREDGSPLVKILDFGIAKMAAETGSLTQSGQFLGTPFYMAPEQADSEGVVTGRADLYALGLIAFRLLVGKSYWKTGTLPQLLAQILAEPMVPPSTRGATFGEAFDTWFLRACAREPGRRYESAFDEVEALAAALGAPEQARAVTPQPLQTSAPVTTLEAAPTLDASSRELTTVRTRKRRRWLAMVAGGVAAAGALAVAAVIAQPRAPAPATLTIAPSQAGTSTPLAVTAPGVLAAPPSALPIAPLAAAPTSDAGATTEPGVTARPAAVSARPARGGGTPPLRGTAPPPAKKDPLDGQY